MTLGTILTLISAALSIARYLISWAEQKRWLEEGAAQAVENGIKEAENAIAKANEARQRVRDSIAADPKRVRDNDEFERTDGD